MPELPVALVPQSKLWGTVDRAARYAPNSRFCVNLRGQPDRNPPVPGWFDEVMAEKGLYRGVASGIPFSQEHLVSHMIELEGFFWPGELVRAEDKKTPFSTALNQWLRDPERYFPSRQMIEISNCEPITSLIKDTVQ